MNYFNYSTCILENARNLLIEHIKYVLIRIRDLHSNRTLIKENEDGSFEIKIDDEIYDVCKNNFTANKIIVDKDGASIIISANKINADIKSYNIDELVKLSDILDYML